MCHITSNHSYNGRMFLTEIQKLSNVWSQIPCLIVENKFKPSCVSKSGPSSMGLREVKWHKFYVLCLNSRTHIIRGPPGWLLSSLIINREWCKSLRPLLSKLHFWGLTPKSLILGSTFQSPSNKSGTPGSVKWTSISLSGSSLEPKYPLWIWERPCGQPGCPGLVWDSEQEGPPCWCPGAMREGQGHLLRWKRSTAECPVMQMVQANPFYL